MKKASIFFFFIACIPLFSQGIPYGQQFQVDADFDGINSNPVVVASARQGFIIFWRRTQNDVSAIFGQVFDSSGVKQGKEFQISTMPLDSFTPLGAAPVSGGKTVVVWRDMGSANSTPEGILGQWLDASGEKTGGKFPVNTSTIPMFIPRISALFGGGFVVCWIGTESGAQNAGCYGQLFDNSGKKVGDEFKANTYSGIDSNYPSVAALSGGGFVVCWIRRGENSSSVGVYGQLFDSNGKKRGGEFTIHPGAEYFFWEPNVTGLSGGRFVVCWRYGDGTNANGMTMQLFDDSGQKEGREFILNPDVVFYDMYSGMASLSKGGFLIYWGSCGRENFIYSVYGQLFNDGGEKKGGEFRVNSRSIGNNVKPCVASLPAGDAVICWETWNQDFSQCHIYAKRYPSSPVVHRLQPFDLLEPRDDTTVRDIPVRAAWRRPSGQAVGFPFELHYKIFLDHNPDFYSPDIQELDADTAFTIKNLQPGKTYFWKVLAKNIAGDSLWSSNTNAFFVTYDATSVESDATSLLNSFSLHQNYPNPFNSETVIRFVLPSQAFVTIKIYDIHGKLIRILAGESREAGSYQVKWDGMDFRGLAVPSGVYICSVEFKSADGKTMVKNMKMGLMK